MKPKINNSSSAKLAETMENLLRKFERNLKIVNSVACVKFDIKIEKALENLKQTICTEKRFVQKFFNLKKKEFYVLK